MSGQGNTQASQNGTAPLRILHVLRAPLGGLFRHVIDLTREQVARGHAVGLICDATTGGATADRILQELAPSLQLGVTRIAMQRNPNFGDIAAFWHVMQRTRSAQPDIVHGHGSKGGLYARLPGLWSKKVVRAYTPHGGSFNYRPGTAIHKIYMGAERLLKNGTGIFLFESEFIETCFRTYAGDPKALSRTVWNGISDTEFVPVASDGDAVDFLYIGELRAAKGIDTFIDALAEIDRSTAFRPCAVLAGTGPDRDHLMQQVARRGLADRVSFAGALPARTAFQRARIMVVPSRAESLPYVVLEAAGAHMPMVSTNVGGIPEIFGPFADRLIACDDAGTMAASLIEALRKPPGQLANEAAQLAQFVASRFTIAHMVDAVVAGYRDALVAKQGLEPAQASLSALVEGH